jgi:FkbH-like protein
MRGNLYVTERLRREEEKLHMTKEDFLQSLSLELFIYKNDDSCTSRIAQLTEKTNQFNIYKNPMTEKDILSKISGTSHDVYHGKLQDTFGDYGIIMVASILKEGAVWTIESLLMSCRVFGKGVEDAFFCALVEDAKKAKVETLAILYQQSDKNIPAQEFIARHFTDFKYNVSTHTKNSSHILVHTYETI